MKNLLSQQKYLYLILGITIFLIYAVFLAILFFGRGSGRTSEQTIAPTPIPTPTISSQTKPAVRYSQESVDHLTTLLKERTTLNDSARTIKAALIAPLSGKSGVIKTTKTYALSYIQSANVFQAEITTIDIQTAKSDAVIYLETKGFNQNDICHLPLVFYLSKHTAASLRGKNLSFNPLPDGC